MSSTREKSAAREAGFTLIELMITVAIVSILAATALPMFSAYVGKSRTVEATGFLQEVKARQESYRFDFGMYCDASGTRGNYYPSTEPSEQLQSWAPVNPFRVLGAAPSGNQSRFVYSTVAGVPGQPGNMPGDKGFAQTDPDRGYPRSGSGPADFWFITTAVGDLDGDCSGADDNATNAKGPCNMVFESYSHSRGIYSSVADGYE